MRDILFIGGPRHNHRMPLPVNLEHLPVPFNVLKFGDDVYTAANENGYAFHPDEAARKTWIMWHEQIMITQIERTLYPEHMFDDTFAEAEQQKLTSLKIESEMLQGLQLPHVYSQIRMIKFRHQRRQAIRYQWSWLGFPIIELETPVVESRG